MYTLTLKTQSAAALAFVLLLINQRSSFSLHRARVQGST